MTTLLENGFSEPTPARTKVLERIRTFPAMPAFVTQVITLLNDPHADAALIASQVKFDPGMTANILRLANSAEFGARRSVRSLQEAVVRLGLKQLFQLVVANGMTSRYSRPMPGYDLQPDELLRHSLWAALAAEEFCTRLSMPMPDLLFTAGLLHDLGKLILDDFIALEKTRIQSLLDEKKRSFDTIETKVLGICHAEAGAAIVDHWHFPPELVATARWHHKPEQAGEHKTIASVVHLAEFLSYSQGLGTGIDGLSYRLSQEAIDHLGVRPKDLEWVASRTLFKMCDLEKILKG